MANIIDRIPRRDWVRHKYRLSRSIQGRLDKDLDIPSTIRIPSISPYISMSMMGTVLKTIEYKGERFHVLHVTVFGYIRRRDRGGYDAVDTDRCKMVIPVDGFYTGNNKKLVYLEEMGYFR